MKNKLMAALTMSFCTIAFAILPESIEAEFKSGNMNLEMGFFNKAYSGKEKTLTLIKDGNWMGLVEDVLERKFDADVYYYFLGLSAEGLGLNDVALNYFQKSVNASTKCASYLFGDGCYGYHFPENAREKLNAIKGLVAKNAAKASDDLEDDFYFRGVDLKGPIGIGPVKIGMKREMIRAGMEGGGVKIMTTPTLSSKSVAKNPNLVSYDLTVMFVDRGQLVEIILDYSSADRIEGISFELDENLFDDVKSLIVKKYGEPLADMKMKSVACDYKNGAKFTRNDGIDSFTWLSAGLGKSKEIVAKLTDTAVYLGCPQKITDSDSYSSRYRQMTIGVNFVREPVDSPF